jgi:hypothetical protein
MLGELTDALTIHAAITLRSPGWLQQSNRRAKAPATNRRGSLPHNQVATPQTRAENFAMTPRPRAERPKRLTAPNRGARRRQEFAFELGAPPNCRAKPSRRPPKLHVSSTRSICQPPDPCVQSSPPCIFAIGGGRRVTVITMLLGGSADGK